MERSELVAEALGEHIFEWFLRNKRARVARLQDPGHASSSSTATCGRCDERRRWNRSLVFPDPPPPELAQTLDLAGYPWKAVGRRATRRRSTSPPTAGPARSSCADDDPEGAFALVPRAAQARRARSSRCCCSSAAPSSATSSCATTSSTTSASTPFHPRELEARLQHLFWRSGGGTRPELVEYGDLVLNLETYQAAIAGQPLDLTYMEYELLKFLAQHPGKVFTRETLLSAGCGATSTTAAPARSTSTSGACGPSSARSTPT